MAAPALPNQSSIVVPLDWTGQAQNTTMQAAGYILSGTVGLRPYNEATTIKWITDPTTAQSMLNTFKAVNFNGVYQYTCNVRGTINIRLNGSYALKERRSGQAVELSIGVYTV